MHSLEISILKIISYFDVFSYPLTRDEIVFFLDQAATEKELVPALEHLIETKQLWKFNDYYSLSNEIGFINRRLKGNKLARTHIKKAIAVARFLSWIPYVRGIAISGSLSKNFANEKSDLDFFIITSANRLWIVRIVYSILYKIVSVAGMKNWFCLNYFIDELALKIKEHNIFTAVEVSTLMPLRGAKIFEDFFDANHWMYQYLPNCKPNNIYLKDASPTVLKRLAEWILNPGYGDHLNNKLQSFFKRRFEKMIMENKTSEKGLTIGAYEAGKHACKPLPQYFQPRVLAKFRERFKTAEDRYQLINEKVLAPNV